VRYGGNTASISVEVHGENPILFDLGTGLRLLGQSMPITPFAATALVTHIHWDHVQGLPFFPQIHVPGNRLDIYGPHQADGTLAEVFGGLMKPPYFPIHFSELQGDVRFIDVTSEEMAIGNAKVLVRPVPHVGPTVGYRLDWDGMSVTYISDHQAPYTSVDGRPTVTNHIDAGVMELCDGVDLLIHDAQYTPDEFAVKSYWGHCTVDYALMLAKRAGVKALAMFHHDPGHSDERMDELIEDAKCKGLAMGIPEIIGTYEGLVLDL
jgi:phosphoribosyl 1,2-cyclic phosphodiesterase